MKKLLLLFLFVGFSLHAQNPAEPLSITDADEIKLGRVLAKRFAEEEGIKPTPQTKKIDAYLQGVGDRVAAHAQRQLPYRFHFDPSPKFKSAIGLPGGQIFVGSGILAYIDSEDQLAAVLGHEIEHIALNHCRDRLLNLLSQQHLSVKQAAKLKVGEFFPGYGHESELAADREGVKLAMFAGYSSTPTIRLLQTFLILEQQMPNTPSDGEMMLRVRIAQIQALTYPGQSQPAEKAFALP